MQSPPEYLSKQKSIITTKNNEEIFRIQFTIEWTESAKIKEKIEI